MSIALPSGNHSNWPKDPHYFGVGVLSFLDFVEELIAVLIVRRRAFRVFVMRRFSSSA